MADAIFKIEYELEGRIRTVVRTPKVRSTGFEMGQIPPQARKVFFIIDDDEGNQLLRSPVIATGHLPSPSEVKDGDTLTVAFDIGAGLEGGEKKFLEIMLERAFGDR